jgi:rRNA maturation endonuclease Nob1
MKKGVTENKPELKALTWEVKCRQCLSKFEVPVPKGPRDEKELKCPRCGSKELERLDVFNFSSPHCGG